MIPEREREALIRLTMCARRACAICKYEEECEADDFEFQDNLVTENMNILADALRKDELQTKYKKWETKPTADMSTEITTCVGVAMALVEDEFFREPTAEERKAVADYIDSISVPTGVNVFDLMDEHTDCPWK